PNSWSAGTQCKCSEATTDLTLDIKYQRPRLQTTRDDAVGPGAEAGAIPAPYGSESPRGNKNSASFLRQQVRVAGGRLPPGRTASHPIVPRGTAHQQCARVPSQRAPLARGPRRI